MRRMPTRRRGLSFSAIIGMSFLAILIGFLLGNFMITMLEEPEDSQIGVITEEDLQRAVDLQDYNDERPSEGTRETAGDVSQIPTDDPGWYRVQVGAYFDQNAAEAVKEELSEKGYPVYLTPGEPHRIQVGAFTNNRNAEELAEELRDQGYDVIVAR